MGTFPGTAPPISQLIGPLSKLLSPDGVINTVLASSVNYPLHLLIIAICVGLLVKLLSPAMRAEFFHRAPTP